MRYNSQVSKYEKKYCSIRLCEAVHHHIKVVCAIIYKYGRTDFGVFSLVVQKPKYLSYCHNSDKIKYLLNDFRFKKISNGILSEILCVKSSKVVTSHLKTCKQIFLVRYVQFWTAWFYLISKHMKHSTLPTWFKIKIFCLDLYP